MQHTWNPSPKNWLHGLLLPLVVGLSLASQAAVKLTELRQTDSSIVLTVDLGDVAPDTLRVETIPTLSAEADWQTVPIISREALTPESFTLQVPIPETASAFYRIIAEPPQATYPVRINEVSSNNETALADQNGDFSDWIELFNSSPTPVSLAGLFLSDRTDEPFRWALPPSQLDAGATLVIYASGKNRRAANAELHTNFRLNADGETLLLSHATEGTVDQIAMGHLKNDETLGRSPASASDWFTFSPDQATPGQANSNDGRIYVAAPTFSIAPGVYSDPQNVTLIPQHPDTVTHYTTDGSEPTADSPVFSNALAVTQPVAIRARSISAGGATSRIVTGTFLVGTDHQLPIVALAADPTAFDIRDGFLYGFGEHMIRNNRVTANFPYSQSNAWKDREIPVSFELIEPSQNRPFQQDLGLKIFGGWGSRGYPQKSLALFARAQYGRGKLRYPLFPDLEIDAFESFILRNSGNDNQSTHQIPPRPPITEFSRPRSSGSYFVNGRYTLFRDALLQSLVRDLAIDSQAYRPVVVYLNGDYWGIYNLREKLNEHYVASHHPVSSDQVDLIEGYGRANAGTSAFYDEARNFINRNLQRFDTNYETTRTTYFDIESFIDYHLAVIYFQNFDIGNIKAWRDRSNGRFRWMLYDQDYGFHLWPDPVYLPAMARDFSDYSNMFAFYTNGTGTNTGWPNNGGRTLFLRRLLSNMEFRSAFIRRGIDLLNLHFDPDRVITQVNRMANTLRPEIPTHLKRWSWEELAARGHASPFKEEDEPFSLDQWESHVEGLREFARQRPAQLRKDMVAHFRLEGATSRLTLRVEPAGAGTIRNNALQIPASVWTGTYLSEYAPELKALAAPGFEFQSWEGDVTSPGDATTSAQLTPDQPGTVTARFVRTP